MLFCILLASVGLTTLYVNQTREDTEGTGVTIVTSFYPMYIATLNIVGDTEGVTLKNLSEPQTGCLHDFQLTPEDMKLLSGADIFVINGGGIESFMEEIAGDYPDLAVVEASREVPLLQEEEEENAHAWMSIKDYRMQVAAIAEALEALDPEHAGNYEENAQAYDAKLAELQAEQEALAEEIGGGSVVIFHEAYAYIAEDYGLEISYVLDLDEERQVSAGEIADLLAAIETDDVQYVLAEELYGSDMGETVEKEAGVTVIYLDALNRGDYDADSYLDGMRSNMELLKGAL